MPPIPQQQTSRGGLIASLVVAILFAVGFLVWAIMNNAELTKLQQASDSDRKKYERVISSGALGDVTTLTTAFNPDPEKATRSGTLMDMAADQRKGFTRTISGDAEGSEKKAMDEVRRVLAAIETDPNLKAAVPTNLPLTGVIDTLTKKAQGDAAAAAKAKADVAAAQKALQEATAGYQAAVAQRDQAVQAAQQAQQKSGTDAKTAIDEKQKQVDDFAAKVADAEKRLADMAAQQQVELQTRDRNFAKLKSEYDALNTRLAQFRPNTKDSIVRNVDATITQVSPDSVCYVNLGYGDHVNTGLTFEVYDKLDGVPKLNDGTSALDMPKGKASVEVISVGQNSSQCRIVRTAPGQTVSQGDLCVNVVYDRNVKPVFYVYGKFDMDNNQVATDPEADVVRNLITRWGGKVSDKLNHDVDFVILGKEPVVPSYSPEELQQPIPKAKFDEANAALKAFTDIRDQAVSLHIPTLNQTRFLYYTGYFDLAKK
jgi:hypothetical protein